MENIFLCILLTNCHLKHALYEGDYQTIKLHDEQAMIQMMRKLIVQLLFISCGITHRQNNTPSFLTANE